MLFILDVQQQKNSILTKLLTKLELGTAPAPACFESFLHMLARGGEGEYEMKNLEVLQLMLDQPNINVNAKDHLGRTPLMNAVGRNDKTAKMILL